MTIALYAVLLVVGVTLLAISLVRALGGGIERSPRRTPAGPVASTGSARQILRERYAAGELSTEEYQHRLRVLEGGDR